MKYICKFQFHESVDAQFIEQQIAESILTTEDVFGQPRVQLNISYLVSENKAVIDVSDEIGEHVFSVFIGKLNRTIGRKHYSFKRIVANGE